MEIELAWALLALIHAPPAAVLFAPSALPALYGIASDGELAVLLRHRGALFLGLVVLCLWALVDPGTRRAAGGVVGVSVVSFLVLYARAGFPAGPLRKVALVDALGLAPLLVVVVDGWRGPAA